MHQICSELREAGHEVHFVYYPAETDWLDKLPYDALARMREQWTQVHIVAPTRPAHPPPSGSHHELDEWWDPAIAGTLKWLFSVDHFDGIIVNYVWLSRAFEYAPAETLRIIDTHDRVGGRKELLGKQGIAPEFFYPTPTEEIRGLNRADLVIAIKAEEAYIFSRNCNEGTEVTAIPFCEPGEILPAGARQNENVTFGLIGARNSLNRSSTEQLLRVLLDRPEFSAAKIDVVIGGALGEDFLDLKHPRIRVTGRVTDIGSVYAACDAVVVPLSASTGQKVRIGEALARGLPVISHAHAFEGYFPAHPMHSLTSPEAIVDAMLSIGAHPALLEDLKTASTISRTRQGTVAREGMARLIQKTAQNVMITCFDVDAPLLADAAAPWLRLTIAAKAAAELGRAVFWLGLDKPLPPQELPKLETLARSGTVYAPLDLISQVVDQLGGQWVHSLRAAQSLRDCLSRCSATILWTKQGADVEQFTGGVIRDADLQDAPPSGGNRQELGMLVGSRDFAHTYAPFFLGRSNLPLWRTATRGLSMWIVGRRADPLLRSLAAALSQSSAVSIAVWTEEEDTPDNLLSGVKHLNRQKLGARLDRPDLAFLLSPETLSDPLALELLSQAGARCVSFSVQNSWRYRRHAYEVADENELMRIVELVLQATELSLGLDDFGRILPVENFNLSPRLGPAICPSVVRRISRRFPVETTITKS